MYIQSLFEYFFGHITLYQQCDIIGNIVDSTIEFYNITITIGKKSRTYSILHLLRLQKNKKLKLKLVKEYF
jgi:hypothetical protein